MIKRKSKSSGPDVSKITDRIKPVKSLPFKISMVIYGRSGTGKTTLAATFPKPILMLDAREEGTDSITAVDGVDVLPLQSFEDLELAYHYLSSSEGRKYKTLIIDTLTQCQDLCLEEIMLESRRTMATKQDWGKLSQHMKSWIIHLRDLPQHVVFVCQDRTTETDTEDEDQVLQEVGPRLSPSIASTLNAAVKVIGQTYIKEVTKTSGGHVRSQMQYRLRLGPHPYYLTKIRTNKGSYVPESLTDANFDKIVDVMRGNAKPPEPKPKKKEDN